MPATGSLRWVLEISASQLILSILTVYLASRITYLFLLDPLRNIPGPFLCRITPFWSWYHSYIGDESHQIDILHAKHGPIIRISPNQVVIADGKALAPIYTEKGGFLKAPFYENFDAEGHQTIFSARDPAYRNVGSKAVGQMFSVGALKSRSEVIKSCADAFVKKLQDEAEQKRSLESRAGDPVKVDILHLTRGLAINVVGAYLFGEEFGDVNSSPTMFCASAYVGFIVDLGRYFFFPPWLVRNMLAVKEWWRPMGSVLLQRMEKVESWTRALAETGGGESDDDTFQARLLKAGISIEDTDVQMKDVVFAGTDTTALNLSNIMWNLVKHPDVYAKLQAELAEHGDDDDSTYDIQRLPYLDGVIREGLRTLRANPTRLPRVVPPSGYTYSSPNDQTYHLPAGTIVGISPSTLHFNPSVFEDPHAFKPERWLNPTPEMLRDYTPFSLGPRQCIARNLAMMELSMTIQAVVRSDVLNGANTVVEKIEVLEWFNAKIVGGRVDLVWR